MNQEKANDSYSLSSKWYTDKMYFEKEMDQIFLKSWLLVGAESQILDPGDSLFLSIFNQPIICIRQQDYAIKTFFNICRHRAGSLKENINNKSLVCTYHGWVYSINGKLKSPRGFSKSEISIKDLCLRKLNTKIWKGLIFINFCDNPNDFETLFSNVEKKLSPYELKNFTFDRKVSYKIKSNWKVYLDNFLEGLHIPIAHPSLNNVLNYRSYDTKLFKNFSIQSGRLDDSKSPYSSSANSYAYYVAIYPNILFNLAPGRFQTNMIEPINEKECYVHFEYYFDSICKKEKLEDISFSDEIQKEDILICEKVQKNLQSIGFDGGIISGKFETGVKHFQNYIKKNIS